MAWDSFDQNWNKNAWEQKQRDIGNFFGGIGTNVGNFFNGLGNIGNSMSNAGGVNLTPLMQPPRLFDEDMHNKLNKGLEDRAIRQGLAPARPVNPNPNSNNAFLDRIMGKGGNPASEIDFGDGMTDEEREMAAVIAEVKNRIKNAKYVEDPQVRALVDQAFGGSLSAVANARDRASTNYKASDDMLAKLSAADVTAIQGEDLNAIRQSHNDLQSGYDRNLSQATDFLAKDREAELAQRSEMLSRLGIQEAGLGDAGKSQSDAIAGITADTAGAKNQASGYLGADEVRNVESARAASQMGLDRRAALRRDLDSILGNLDNAESTIQNSKAQALLAGLNADKESWNRAYQNDVDTLDMYLDNQREDSQYADKAAAKAKGTSGVIDVVTDRVRSKYPGIDPTPYLQAYYQVQKDNKFNSNSGHDKRSFYLKEMASKMPPDANVAVMFDIVNGVEGYGTDKLTAQ